MSKRRGMSRMTTMEVGVMGATSRAHRRMSVFCSHIRQVENGGASYSPVSQSYCQGSSEEEERASLTGSGKEKDCIFCRISSGESPSFKVCEYKFIFYWLFMFLVILILDYFYVYLSERLWIFNIDCLYFFLDFDLYFPLLNMIQTSLVEIKWIQCCKSAIYK